MAWTAPLTGVTGAILTAADWNTSVRDNLNELRTGGIAIASQAAEDLAVASSATQFARLAKGTDDEVLTMVSGAVAWAAGAGGPAPHTFHGMQLRTHPDSDEDDHEVWAKWSPNGRVVTSDGVVKTPSGVLEGDLSAATGSASGSKGCRLTGVTEDASTWYRVLYCYGGTGEALFLDYADAWTSDEEQTTTSAWWNMDGTPDEVAQTVQLTEAIAADELFYVDLRFYRTGSPGNVTFTIEGDSSGDPDGTPLASAALDGDLIPTSSTGIDVRIVFHALSAISAATTYHLRIVPATADGSNILHIRYNSAGGYAAGEFSDSDDNGSTWNAVNGGGDDIYFKFYTLSTAADNTPTLDSGYDTGWAHVGWVYNDSSSNLKPIQYLDRHWQWLFLDMDTAQVSVTSEIVTLQDFAVWMPPVPVRVWGRTGHATTQWSTFVGGVPDGPITRTSNLAHKYIRAPAGTTDPTAWLNPIHTETQALYITSSNSVASHIWIQGGRW